MGGVIHKVAKLGMLIVSELIYEMVAFIALTLLLGWQEGNPACKN